MDCAIQTLNPKPPEESPRFASATIAGERLLMACVQGAFKEALARLPDRVKYLPDVGAVAPGLTRFMGKAQL
jgi:hypothetical protein